MSIRGKKGDGSVEEYRQMEDRCIDIESVRGGGDGGYGFMDRTGTPVFYLDCDSVSTFQEGLAFISVDGKYGYIDKTGQIVIQPVYDCADYFKGGLAEIWEDNRRGIIDRTGRAIRCWKTPAMRFPPTGEKLNCVMPMGIEQALCMRGKRFSLIYPIFSGRLSTTGNL